MLDDAVLVRVGRLLAELDAENATVRIQSGNAATELLREAGIDWGDLIWLLRRAIAQGMADQLPAPHHDDGDKYCAAPAPDGDWKVSARIADGRPGFWRKREDGRIASIRQCRSVPGYPPAWTASVDGKMLCGPGDKPFYFTIKQEAMAKALGVVW